MRVQYYRFIYYLFFFAEVVAEAMGYCSECDAAVAEALHSKHSLFVLRIDVDEPVNTVAALNPVAGGALRRSDS